MPFRLRTARERAGLNQKQLAARSRVHFTALSHFENDRRPLRQARYDLVERLAFALDYYPHELVEIQEGTRAIGERIERAPLRAAR